LVFAVHEFSYDKFHQNYSSIFRILKRVSKESYTGNRLTNQIPRDVQAAATSIDSVTSARVKLLEKVSVVMGEQIFHHTQWYAADPAVTHPEGNPPELCICHTF
jgi:hypothetical protein